MYHFVAGFFFRSRATKTNIIEIITIFLERPQGREAGYVEPGIERCFGVFI
jgi:hypothetical protein